MDTQNKPSSDNQNPEPDTRVYGELVAADFDNGFKDVAFQTRGGENKTVRITGLDWRRSGQAMIETIEQKDPWLVLLKCLPQMEDKETFMNRILPEDAGRMLAIAFALSFGREFESKMNATADTWLNRIRTR